MSDKPISYLSECSHEIIQLVMAKVTTKNNEKWVPAETPNQVACIIQKYCFVRDSPVVRP